MKPLIIFAIVTILDIFFEVPCASWSALTMYMVVCELEIRDKRKEQDTESIVKRLESEIEDNPEASLSEYRAGLYKAIEIVKGGVE